MLEISELGDAFIIQDIEANVIFSKRGEFETASVT